MTDDTSALLRNVQPANHSFAQAQEKGAAAAAATPCEVIQLCLEGKDWSELRTPIDRRAVWQPGDLGGANTFGIRKSVARVVALFKAELDPGVHLVEDGNGVDRVS